MISFDYYRIFYFAATYKSFTKAAAALNNNQPNITRCINNLEAQLGCRLFVRSNRGIALTPEGEKLYSRVSAAYTQLSLGEAEFKEDQGLDRGIVTIAASGSALRLFLLDRLEAFHSEYPNVQLKISNQTSPQATDEIKSGLADIAVITSPASIPASIRSHTLMTFRECLICGNRYYHLAKNLHSFEALSKLPFIFLSEKTGTRQLYNSFFLEKGVQLHADIEVATMDQILPMVQHNLGLGFYPDKLAGSAEDIFRISLSDSLPERHIYLLERKDLPESIAARKLREFLLDK